MKEKMHQILGTKGLYKFRNYLVGRKKRSTITPIRLAQQVRGITSYQWKDVLHYLSQMGYGTFVSTKGKNRITTPTIRTKFQWDVVPSQILNDLERPDQSSYNPVKASERSQTVSVESAVDMEQTVVIEEVHYRRTTLHHSATNAQDAIKPKN